MQQYLLGADRLASSFAEKELGLWVDTKLNMSRQGSSATRKPASSFAASRRATRSRALMIARCTALARPHAECCVQFWAPQDKTGMDLLEQAQQRATKSMKGLEHLSYEQRLRELALFSLKKARRGVIFSVRMNTCGRV